MFYLILILLQTSQYFVTSKEVSDTADSEPPSQTRYGQKEAPYEQKSELVPMAEYHTEDTHFRVIDCFQCFKAGGRMCH